MTTVEKRRSSRRSHRKHNDGGYSDTETDREVSRLTDRAFRSLCIGDEAIYNDSDLSASPCLQRDRQLTISHNVQEQEARERQELKRTAHESFSLRVQQYGQDWNYRGMYGAEGHKDQQWGVTGEKGRLSATIQQSFVNAPQRECPSRELSLFSNGTAEVSPQPQRSRSRVSSLIQAFNTEGQRDEALYNNETSWDKSALMSIQRELSEFSSYPQNMNTGYFPSAGLLSSQNYYSSEMAAFSQMNSATSFMRSSHSMSTEVNCNSNFFIHSEFSPFKVWRDQNRFPFHRGQVSGFVPCSEFQKWYETPMYKELSLQPQQHPSMFSDQAYHRNTFAPAVPMNPQRSTSASSMMQRASALEKRCESAGHYWKRAQSTGANRLALQRPSTASPSSEMSRQVRDTISSVKSLQHKIKMMAEQNLETQSQGGFYDSNYLSPYGSLVQNPANSNHYTDPYQMQKSPVYVPQEPQQCVQNHSASPQPVEHAPVRAESRGATPDIKMSGYKSRAASLLYNLKDNRKRVKATYNPSKPEPEKLRQEPKDFVIDVPEFPDNELINCTDQRARMLEAPQYGYQGHSPGMMQTSQYTQNALPEAHTDRNRLNIPQHGYQVHSPGLIQYPQHPQYPQPEFAHHMDRSIKLNVPQYGYQGHSPGMLQNAQHMDNSQHFSLTEGRRLDAGPYGYQAHSPRMLQSNQFPQSSQNMHGYPGQNSSEYYRAHLQGELVPHHGFSSYTPEYYANNKLANGQNPYENISSFTPYKQGVRDTGEGNYINRLVQNTAAEMQRFGAVGQSRDYVSKDNNKQQFNEAASGEFTGVDRYNQVKENKCDYNNVYSQDMWGQTNSQEIHRPQIPLAPNCPNVNAYQRANVQDNVQSYNYEQMLIENYGARSHGTVTSSVPNEGPMFAQTQNNAGNPGYPQQQPQPGTYRGIYAPPTSHENNKENKMKENYAPQDNHKYYDQESKKQTIISSQGGVPIATVELGQRKDPAIKENGKKGMQLKETEHFENSEQTIKVEQAQEEEDQVPNNQFSPQHSEPKDELKENNTAEERSKVEPHQHKEELKEDISAKSRGAQDEDLPKAEEQIKQLQEEKSNSAPLELREVTDEQRHVGETERQRPDSDRQLEHANAVELKEEAIKCELAASSREARIEQVKPEPGHKEWAITDQANETQVDTEHVRGRREEDMQEEEKSEAKRDAPEPISEKDAHTTSEETKEQEVMAITDETLTLKTQNAKDFVDASNPKVINDNSTSVEKANTEKARENETNWNNVKESASKCEPTHSLICEPDQVEQVKTELAETKAELANIKVKIETEPKVQKDEQHDEQIDQINEDSVVQSKEPPATNKVLDSADRGADDYERIREKYGYNQAADKNKTSISDRVSEQPTLTDTDRKDEITESTMNSSLACRESINSTVVSEATEDTGKSNTALYENPAESQYVYSESSKDFKLSVVSNVVNPEDKTGGAAQQEAPLENSDEKSDDNQSRDCANQVLDDERTLSKYISPESTDIGTDKSNNNKVKDVPIEVDKVDISLNKDAKPAVVERKQKSADLNSNTNKETSVKGQAHKEKAQTKHEILTSKIKAHAEKEISAIKEGFAIRDGLKNPTKALVMTQNANIRQKPPSQDVFTKTEKSVHSDTSKGQTSSAAKTVTAEPPPRQVQAAAGTAKTKSMKSAEKTSNQKDKTGRSDSLMDDKTEKPEQQSRVNKEDHADLSGPEKPAPCLQLVFGQNESCAQDDSLKIMGIMVTVKERPTETNGEDNKNTQESLKTNINTAAESNICGLSGKVTSRPTEEHDHNKTKNITRDLDYGREKNAIDCAAKKSPGQGTERSPSETQLPHRPDEEAEPLTITVPAKNNVLAATQPATQKQETKEYANRTSADQEEIAKRVINQDLPPTFEMSKVVSETPPSNCEKSQRDNLHIDSIAIRVVPAEEAMTTGSSSRASLKSSPSNDDVQKVLSSVRKQAQLLKHSNQQNVDNTASKNAQNDLNKTADAAVDETAKPLIEDCYFQVEKRPTEPQDSSASVGQMPDKVSRTLSQTLKGPAEMHRSNPVNLQDVNTKTAKQTVNLSNIKSNEEEQTGAGPSHRARRPHHQRDRHKTLPSTDNNAEVKPKPKVPIPEISALADYARLKVIVSKDKEDNLQETPPNKKEGFFPLIQTRHSRRPVFTVDLPEDSVTENPSQNQSEASVKASKEHKSVVFPLTEKQYQTGMFKLGDKETKHTGGDNTTQEEVKEEVTRNKSNTEHPTEKKIKHMLEKSRATQAEEEKKAAQREGEQRAREREAIAAQIRERRKKQREPERNQERDSVSEQQSHPEVNDGRQEDQKQSTQTEQQERAALKEERKLIQEEASRKNYQQRALIREEKLNKTDGENQQRKAEDQKKTNEEQSNMVMDENQRKAAQMDEQRRLFHGQQKRAAQEETVRKMAEEKQQKRDAVAQEQRTAALKGQKTKTAAEEHLNKAQQKEASVENEQQRKVQTDELRRQAAHEQHLKKNEHQKQFTLEEQQRKAALEEKQRRAAQTELQRKEAMEEQQRKAAMIEEQQRCLREEQKRAVEEEHLRNAALIEEQKRKSAADEQKRATSEEEQRGKALEKQQKQVSLIKEQRRQASHEEHLRKMAQEEQHKRQTANTEEQRNRAVLEEEQRTAALKEKHRGASLEEQQRNIKMTEEEPRQKAAIREEQRKALDEQRRKEAHIEEQQRHEEQLRKMAEEEQQRKAALLQQKRREEQQGRYTTEQQQKKAAQEEREQKAALEEERRKIKTVEEEQRRKAAEEKRKAAEEQQKAVILEEQRRKAAHEEQLRKTAEEEKQRKEAYIKEQQRHAAHEEHLRRMAEEELQRKAATEKQRKAAEEQRKAAEEQRKAAEEQQKAAILEEQRKKAAHEEQLRRTAEEELQRKAAIEEQRKAAEEQRKAAEEQQKAVIMEEQRRKAAHEEQLRKMAEEDKQRKEAYIKEQQRQAAHEEHLRRTAEEELQRKAAEEQRKAAEEQQKAAMLEEQRRKAAHEEQFRKTAEEEQQRKAAIIEQKRRAAFEEQQACLAIEQQQKKAAQEEREQKAVLEEQWRQRKMVEEEQQREAAKEEQRKAAEEQQKAAMIEEQRRKAAHEEHLRKMAEEEQRRKTKIIEEQKKKALIEEQHKRFALEEQQRKSAEEKQTQRAALEERKMSEKDQQRKVFLTEESKNRAALEEHRSKAAEEQKMMAALVKERQRRSEMEEQSTALKEKKREDMQTEKQRRSQQEEEDQFAFSREERIKKQIEEAREAKLNQGRRELQDQPKTGKSSNEVRPQDGKQKSQETEYQVQNGKLTNTEKDARGYREEEMRQNKMDVGAKMAGTQVQAAETERLSKTHEALQYYSLTSAEVEKSSPPQMRNNAIGTAEDSCRPLAPASPALSLPRSSAASPAFGAKPSMFKVKDNTGRGSCLTKSVKPCFHKNFGEEFRVGSPMERVRSRNEEDQVLLRNNAGTPVYSEKSPSTPLPEHRPFSRRSLALDEEDCRSIISNMSDVESFATSAADLADIRGLYDSDRPESACSFSSDVSRSLGKPPAVPPKSEKALRRAKRLATRKIKKESSKVVTEDFHEASMFEDANADAVASPHFASPISIAHAPPAGSSVSSSHSYQRSFQAPSHASVAVSSPTASVHTSAPVSVPLLQQPGSFSTPAAPKSLPQVALSPTHNNAPKPVTQYQVESGFAQPYTQRRVMQDIGSGQYYVVDVPVEVKTKTFFDPETGKYVQLNVRESNRTGPQRQPLQAYPQPHLKPKIHAKPQPTPPANALYQGYQSYPKGYQSAATSSAPVYQSGQPETVTQDKQPVRSGVAHQYRGTETEQSYSPDKAPYMDTVNNADKVGNAVYSTHGANPAAPEGGRRFAGSRRNSRDIITMSELEDFMEVSDW